MSWQTTYRDLAHLVPPVAERSRETPEARESPDAGSPQRRAWLEVAFDRDRPATTIVDIPHDRAIEIGRGDSSGLTIDDPVVSRLHAALVSHPDGHYTICDLESANGVWLNGTRVAEAALADGDRIRIGPAILTFRTAFRPEG